MHELQSPSPREEKSTLKTSGLRLGEDLFTETLKKEGDLLKVAGEPKSAVSKKASSRMVPISPAGSINDMFHAKINKRKQMREQFKERAFGLKHK
jgi:hypothetical protein